VSTPSIRLPRDPHFVGAASPPRGRAVSPYPSSASLLALRAGGPFSRSARSSRCRGKTLIRGAAGGRAAARSPAAAAYSAPSPDAESLVLRRREGGKR
jgi:hypothetical protein